MTVPLYYFCVSHSAHQDFIIKMLIAIIFFIHISSQCTVCNKCTQQTSPDTHIR